MNGYRKGTSNYSPLALWTALSELLEKATYERLCQHVSSNNVMS